MVSGVWLVSREKTTAAQRDDLIHSVRRSMFGFSRGQSVPADGGVGSITAFFSLWRPERRPACIHGHRRPAGFGSYSRHAEHVETCPFASGSLRPCDDPKGGLVETLSKRLHLRVADSHQPSVAQ